MTTYSYRFHVLTTTPNDSCWRHVPLLFLQPIPEVEHQATLGHLGAHEFSLPTFEILAIAPSELPSVPKLHGWLQYSLRWLEFFVPNESFHSRVGAIEHQLETLLIANSQCETLRLQIDDLNLNRSHLSLTQFRLTPVHYRPFALKKWPPTFFQRYYGQKVESHFRFFVDSVKEHHPVNECVPLLRTVRKSCPGVNWKYPILVQIAFPSSPVKPAIDLNSAVLSQPISAQCFALD